MIKKLGAVIVGLMLSLGSASAQGTFPGVNPIFNGNAFATGTLGAGSLSGSGISCVEANNLGVFFLTGQACGQGGAGAVNSVSNSDGSLTFSPTTGAVVGSVNYSHAGSWLAVQTFLANSLTFGELPQITSSTVLGNFTGGTANVAAQTVPSCANDGSHALTNNAGSGFNCTLVTGGGGGGGGLVVTRAQIPSVNTNGTAQLVVTGFSSPGDPGNGAPYNCNNQRDSDFSSIQDSQGTWCTIDVNVVRNMDGYRPGWFGAKGDGSTDDTKALQQTIDTSYLEGVNNVYCSAPSGFGGAYVTSYPLYNDPPGGLRGGANWGPVNPFVTGTYPPGQVVRVNGTYYANQTGDDIFGEPPTSPDYSGVGFDLGYKIVSSTSAVTYNPTWTNPAINALAVVPFKGSGGTITPTILAKGAEGLVGTNSVSIRAVANAPIGSTVVIAFADQGGDLASGTVTVTDSKGNPYTKDFGIENGGTTGGLWFFHSANIANALTAVTDTISVNDSGQTFQISLVAVSLSNATSGVDSTASASVNNLNTPGNAPSVTSGTLSQTNEIVFGAAFNFWGAGARGFAESAGGWTTTTPNRWTSAIWNAGTTYTNGAVVYWPADNPIPWTSLANGNMGNDPLNDMQANAPLVHWQPITETTTQANENKSFIIHGPGMASTGSDSSGQCIIKPQFNNSFFFANNPANGGTLRHLAVIGPNGGTRCGQPLTGIGIVDFAMSGGSNQTEYEDVSIQNVYWGALFAAGNAQNPFSTGTLGAENHLEYPEIKNTCYGFRTNGTQAFINSIHQADIADNFTAAMTSSTQGLEVTGGNFSHENGPFINSAFVMTAPSVSVNGQGFSFTTTITPNGDPYLVQLCNESISPSNLPIWPGEITGNSGANDVSCTNEVYNAWSVYTSDFGPIPMILTSYNPSTHAATFWNDIRWWNAFCVNTCWPSSAVATEIGQQTVIFAAEMTRKFVGNNISVNNIHLEDAGPFQLADANVGFGEPAPVTLSHIYFNSDYTNCGNYSAPTPTTAASGTGSTVTITTAALPSGYSYNVGSSIIVYGVTPTGYNGVYTVTASTNTTVSFASSTTGAQSVAGNVIGIYSNGSNTINQPSVEAACFAQQEFPFFNVSNGDIIVEDTVGGGASDYNMVDFGGAGPPTAGNHFIQRGQNGLAYNFRYPACENCLTNVLTGNYSTSGSPAFGTGDFQYSPFLGFENSAGLTPGYGFSGTINDQAWMNRSQGLGKSPFSGTLPDPASTPCISPVELAKALGPLPAIYSDSNFLWQVNYALLASGQQYKVCSPAGFSAPAWSSGGNYYPGSMVTSAGNIYVSIAGDPNSAPNRNNTPGTPAAFTGSISGTTLTVTAIATGSVVGQGALSGTGVTANSTIVAQISGTPGSTGTYLVEPGQTVASTNTLRGTYWVNMGTTQHYGAVSNHIAGYSYGQDLSAGVQFSSGFAWTVTSNSPFMQLPTARTEDFGLLFQGLVIGALPTQVGCGGQENFAIRGVHTTLKFLDLFNVGSDVGNPQVPTFGASPCSNTLLKQAPYSITNLN